MGHGVIQRLIKKHGRSSCGGCTAHLQRHYLCCFSVEGVGRSRWVPCLSRGWRGATWVLFYKPAVPEAPAPTSVGNHQALCGGFLRCILSTRRLEPRGLDLGNPPRRMKTFTCCSQNTHLNLPALLLIVTLAEPVIYVTVRPVDAVGSQPWLISDRYRMCSHRIYLKCEQRATELDETTLLLLHR